MTGAAPHSVRRHLRVEIDAYDATMPAEPTAAEATWRAWADHMVAQGIDERRAFEHFEEWSAEDTYFPLEEELAAVAAAGFDAECVWREAGIAVVVGRKFC